jgi:hypothetical protein
MISFDNLGRWGKILLFFYLIIAGNYIGNTFSCRIQYMLNHNIFVRHFIAILTLYFFVLIVDNKLNKYSPFKMIFICIIVYLYFLVAVKNKKKYFIISIIILIILTFLQNNKEYLKEKKKKNKYDEIYLKYINHIQFCLIIVMSLITIFGFIVYLGEKEIEYGKKFNAITFIFGTNGCKNNNMNDNFEDQLDFKYFIKGTGIFEK